MDYFSGLASNIYSCADIIGAEYMKYIRGETKKKPDSITELLPVEQLALWLSNIEKFDSKKHYEQVNLIAQEFLGALDICSVWEITRFNA